MMVDFAVEAQRQGKTPAEAIHEACLVRFRPIMMTTMAALVGTLPIALGLGAGAESRRPLGLAVVGGLRRVAAADALHHAGLLRLHRGRPCPPDASSSRKGASGSPSRRALINGPTGRRGESPVQGATVPRSDGPKVRRSESEVRPDHQTVRTDLRTLAHWTFDPVVPSDRLFHVPVAREAHTDATEVIPDRWLVEPAVAHLRADRKLRHAGERQLASAEELRSVT